jgi:RNA polymerase sigma-70 factor (ECF subfamily)
MKHLPQRYRRISHTTARDVHAVQTKDTSSVNQLPSPADLSTLRDEELLALVARRHDEALGALYDRYIRLVYAVALRITGDRHTAEEVVQDVFQNVWQAASTFQAGAGSCAAWLLGITRHRAIDVTRSKRERARAREEALDQSWSPSGGLQPEDEVDQRLLRDTVRAALGDLPAVQRQAIELAYYGGLTRSEIAAELGEPVGTIKTRLRLGLLKLRDLLRPTME